MRDVALMWLLLGWFGLPVYGQVEIPEGFEIVEIVSSEYPTGFPAINRCGQVVFDRQLERVSSSKEIFLYDNGRLERITENDVRDRWPAIDDAGRMVWARTIGKAPDNSVILYEDGRETVLESRRYGLADPAINNLGHVTWSRFRRSDCPLAQDVVVWDGREVTRITPKDDFNDQAPEINDDGWIVWGHSNNCVNPWEGDIRLYRDGVIEVLPNDTDQPQSPAVNNNGQVVWKRTPGLASWKDGKTVLLTDWSSKPSLNNLGDVYLSRWHEDIQVHQPWLYRVSDGEPHFHRLAADGAGHGVGDITDWGEAVWDRNAFGGHSNGELYLRRIRTGDSEFDADVDLMDYAVFGDCMTGPGRVDRLCDCRFLDIDHDGDVDLGDFALFQEAFEGK